MPAPTRSPSFCEGDPERCLGQLDLDELTCDEGGLGSDEPIDEPSACLVKRLRLDERTNNQARVQRDPLGKEERRILDRKHAPGRRGATASADHLPRAVERGRDANVDAEAGRGTLDRGPALSRVGDLGRPRDRSQLCVR